jgi:flagellar hook-length control protein FliK
MPSDVRNSIYPTTVVDLLLPPAGGAARSGEGEAGFDSLLRALAPAPSPPTPQDAPPPSQPRREYAGSENSDTRSAPTSRQARQPDERPVAGRGDSSAQNDGEKAPGDRAVEAKSETRPASGSDENQGQVSGESAHPQDEVKSPEAAGDEDPETAEKDDLSSTVLVVDPAIQQLAALPAKEVAKGTAPVGQEALDAVDRETAPESVEAAKKTPDSAPASGACAPFVDPMTAKMEGRKAANVQPLVAVPEEAAASAEGAPQVEVAKNAEVGVEIDAPAVEDTVEAIAEESSGTTAIEIEVGSEESVQSSETKRAKPEHPTVGASEGKQKQTSPDESADGRPAEAVEVNRGDSIAPDAVAAVESRQPAGDASGDRDRKKEREAEAIDAPKPIAPSEAPTVDAGTATPDASAAEGTVPTAPETSSAEPKPLTQSTPLFDANARPTGAPRLAAEVLSAGPREASHQRPIEIDSARFLTRVARAFASAQERGGEVQLRLSPPELGSLRIEVRVQEGVLTARVETESAAARSAVLEHLPQLRERLAEQGVRIERFDVDLMQQGSSGTPDRPSDRESDRPQPNRPLRTPSAAAPQTAARPTMGGLSPTGGLNVIV